MMNVEGAVEELRQQNHSLHKEVEALRSEVQEVRRILFAAFPSLVKDDPKMMVTRPQGVNYPRGQANRA